MNLSEKIRKNRFFREASEAALYITAPAINLTGGFSGKSKVVISKKGLPKEITSAKILLVDKTTILLSCNFKKQHAPFHVRLYIQFSDDTLEHFIINKEAQNLGYAYSYVRDVAKDEPAFNISLGKLKDDYKIEALADVFHPEHTKIVIIPAKAKK